MELDVLRLKCDLFLSTSCNWKIVASSKRFLCY